DGGLGGALFAGAFASSRTWIEGALDNEHALGGGDEANHGAERNEQKGQRHPRSHGPMGFAGSGDDLRAGRFAGGEDFLKRVSARERGGDSHGAGGAFLRIFFKTAQDHAVDD